MNKKNKRRLLDDRRIVLVLAFTLAIVSWIIVAGFINPGKTVTIPNVRIDYNKKADELTKRDLQIVTDLSRVSFADVMVSGDGSTISRFTNTDVMVYADFSSVNGPGTHMVPLKAEKVTSGNYSIVDWTLRNSEHSFRNSPINTVELTFEKIERKSFPITVHADDITAAPGFFRDNPELSQAEIVVSGPTSEISRVAQVAAVITEDEERSESKIFTVPLVLLDAQGNEIESEHLTIAPVDAVEVTIPILEIREIKLEAGFIGMPANLDTDWFLSRISLTTNEIKVLGTAQAFQNLSNPFTIGQIDITELGLNWQSEPLTIELPEGLRTQDPMRQVVVNFDSEGLVERTFEVTNMTSVNVPSNVGLNPLNEKLSATSILQTTEY